MNHQKMNSTKFNKKEAIIQNYYLEKNIYPEITLGTWKFGGYNFGKYYEKDALETLHYAYENKIRCFDIASFYAKGQSNNVLKKFLKNKSRSDYILCAKVGLDWNKNKVINNGSKKRILQELEDLQHTFNTDYIDILLLHWPDPNIILSESLESLNRLKEKKKINFTGICNINKTHLDEIKLFNLDTIHLKNNVLKNIEMTPLVKEVKKDYFTTIFSIFENGFLISDYHNNILKLGKKDFRRKKLSNLSKSLINKLNIIHAKKVNNYSHSEIIYTWTLENLDYDSIIIGPKNINQLKLLTELKTNKKKINEIKQSELYTYLNEIQRN